MRTRAHARTLSVCVTRTCARRAQGVQLERRMGSVRFAGLVVELMLLESSLLTLGCWLASRVAHEYRWGARGHG